VRRAVYRGPPRSDDEKKFFDVMRRLVRVPKREVDEREKARKLGSTARQSGNVKSEGDRGG
jgi:hypothetical protein